MKVKVTHTVNLEDVPEIIDKTVSSMRDSLTICSSKVKFNPANLPKMILNYNEVRERLDLIDSQLEDVINISTGWHQAMQPSPPPPPPEEVVVPGEDTIIEEQD
tara:strand:+ start:367 stop:678 length:312 start_codon:yes stop_codon:yes gene_type:complete